MMGTAHNHLVVFNGTVITPDHEISNGVVIVHESKIVGAGKRGTMEEPKEAVRIDAEGHFITPGLIDIHVNGAMGADVTKADGDTFSTMGSFFIKHGVTAYLATAITSADHDLLNTLELARKEMLQPRTGIAELLGIHMEGPYLSQKQSGAHPHAHLTQPLPDHYKQFLVYNDVLKKMTLAPELKKASTLVRDLRKAGVIAAAGHTNGIYDEMIPAINEGITHATHFFCNMSHFRRDQLKRVAGAVETLLYDDRVTGEIIADGWHVGPSLMKLLVKVKGVDQVCFVTDAMPATGMPAGSYFIGEVEAIVENGIARLPDNSAYAGSVTTMDVCVRNGLQQMDLSLKDAVRMGTLTPAEIIGVSDRKGSLEKNKDADFLIVDERFHIQKTFIGGELVFEK